jgi:hypothetical protein
VKTLADALRKVFPECAGKINYASASEAWAAIRDIRAGNEAHNEPERSIGLHVYECTVCGGLHVGHVREDR